MKKKKKVRYQKSKFDPKFFMPFLESLNSESSRNAIKISIFQKNFGPPMTPYTFDPPDLENFTFWSEKSIFTRFPDGLWGVWGGLWVCCGVIWVGFWVCREVLSPKSRSWPCDRPVERPSGADLAMATTQ